MVKKKKKKTPPFTIVEVKKVLWRSCESESEAAQSCPTLCNTMDCSLSGFSIHGIFQARVLEWGAMYGPVIPQRSLDIFTLKFF